jgi:hypothetical protein
MYILFVHKEEQNYVIFRYMMELESLMAAKLARLRRTNTACFLSYVKSRFKKKNHESKIGTTQEDNGA